MKKAEMLQIIGRITVTYPRHFDRLTTTDLDRMVEVWADVMEDYTFEQVCYGLKAFIASDTKGFPPVPGQIIDQIVKASATDQIQALEAWDMVRRAARNSTYNSEEEFAKLPEIVRKVLASPSALSAMAALDSDSIGVQQAHFIKAFNEELKRQEYTAKLPESVKALYQKTTPRIERTVIDGRLLIAE